MDFPAIVLGICSSVCTNQHRIMSKILFFLIFLNFLAISEEEKQKQKYTLSSEGRGRWKGMKVCQSCCVLLNQFRCCCRWCHLGEINWLSKGRGHSQKSISKQIGSMDLRFVQRVVRSLHIELPSKSIFYFQLWPLDLQ